MALGRLRLWLITWFQAQQRIAHVVVCNLPSIYVEVQSFADNSGHTKMKKALILASKSSQSLLEPLETLEILAQVSLILFFKLLHGVLVISSAILMQLWIKERKKLHSWSHHTSRIKLFLMICVSFHFLSPWIQIIL